MLRYAFVDSFHVDPCSLHGNATRKKMLFAAAAQRHEGMKEAAEDPSRRCAGRRAEEYAESGCHSSLRQRLRFREWETYDCSSVKMQEETKTIWNDAPWYTVILHYIRLIITIFHQMAKT
jgi:hypothetical protein